MKNTYNNGPIDPLGGMEVKKSNKGPLRSNIQKLGDIEFDANAARNFRGITVVKDRKTGKDYGVVRNSDGSFKFLEDQKAWTKLTDEEAVRTYYNRFINSPMYNKISNVPADKEEVTKYVKERLPQLTKEAENGDTFANELLQRDPAYKHFNAYEESKKGILKTLNNTKVISSTSPHGSHYDGKTGNINVNTKKDIANGFLDSRDVLAHEFSHAKQYVDDTFSGMIASPINSFNTSSKRITDFINSNNADGKHDLAPDEYKADINALRFRLMQEGVYDPTKESFTPEHYKKAMSIPSLLTNDVFNRVRRLSKSKSHIIDALNSITSTENNSQIQTAAMGGKLNKYGDGGPVQPKTVNFRATDSRKTTDVYSDPDRATWSHFLTKDPNRPFVTLEHNWLYYNPAADQYLNYSAATQEYVPGMGNIDTLRNRYPITDSLLQKHYAEYPKGGHKVQNISQLVDPTAEFPTNAVHKVVAGDTLGAIAKKYNVSIVDLAKANKIANVNRIEKNQELVIPSGNPFSQKELVEVARTNNLKNTNTPQVATQFPYGPVKPVINKAMASDEIPETTKDILARLKYQESRGKADVVSNKTNISRVKPTYATGYYQFVPKYWGSQIRSFMGLDPSTSIDQTMEQFKNNPEVQDKFMAHVVHKHYNPAIKKIYSEAKKYGLGYEDLIKLMHYRGVDEAIDMVKAGDFAVPDWEMKAYGNKPVSAYVGKELPTGTGVQGRHREINGVSTGGNIPLLKYGQPKFTKYQEGGVIPSVTQSDYTTKANRDKTGKEYDTSGRKVLRKGMTEDVPGEITQLQAFLQNKGFYKGEQDGIYGSKTEEAVRNYQKWFNKNAKYDMKSVTSDGYEMFGSKGKTGKIKEDGVVGDQTRAALMYREPMETPKVTVPQPKESINIPVPQRVNNFTASDSHIAGEPDQFDPWGGLMILGAMASAPLISEGLTALGETAESANAWKQLLRDPRKLPLPKGTQPPLNPTVPSTPNPGMGGRFFGPKTPSGYGTRVGYSKGGSIQIDPSKKGTFTAAANKHHESVQGFAAKVLANKENYSPAMVKKANFARNAAHWHHATGGDIGSVVSAAAPLLALIPGAAPFVPLAGLAGQMLSANKQTSVVSSTPGNYGVGGIMLNDQNPQGPQNPIQGPATQSMVTATPPRESTYAHIVPRTVGNYYLAEDWQKPGFDIEYHKMMNTDPNTLRMTNSEYKMYFGYDYVPSFVKENITHRVSGLSDHNKSKSKDRLREKATGGVIERLVQPMYVGNTYDVKKLASGGQVDQKLSDSSFQVKGNPQVTDGNYYPSLNAKLDHNEVVVQQQDGNPFVFSTKLKDPSTKKPFSHLAATYERAKGKAEKMLQKYPYNEQAKATIAHSNNALNTLADKQEKLATYLGHRNPDGSTVQKAAVGGMLKTYADGGPVQVQDSLYYDPEARTFMYKDGNSFTPVPPDENALYIHHYKDSPILQNLALTNPASQFPEYNARFPQLKTVQAPPQVAPVPSTSNINNNPVSSSSTGSQSSNVKPTADPYVLAFQKQYNRRQTLTNDRDIQANYARYLKTGISTPLAVNTLTEDGVNGPKTKVARQEYANYLNKISTGQNRILANLNDHDPMDDLAAASTLGQVATPGQSINGAALAAGVGVFDNTKYNPASASTALPSTTTPSNNSYKTPWTAGDSLKVVELLTKGIDAFKPAEKEPQVLDNTQISQQVYDPRNAVYQNQRNFQNLANTTSGPSLNLRRGLLNSALANTMNNNANILTQYQQMNQQAVANYQDRLSNQRRFNTQSILGTNQINAQNRAARDMIQQNLGASIGQFGEDLNRKVYANDYISMMQQVYPDVYNNVIAGLNKNKK